MAEFKSRALREPCFVRRHSTDLQAMEQVLLNHDYALALTFKPRAIVDLGAYIGLSATYFATRYPEATVVAVEPERANYELLVRNARAYPNVRPYQAGIWHREGWLAVLDHGNGAWGHVVREVPPASPGSVLALSLPTLLREAGIKAAEVIKIDIEGAEQELFEGDTSWLEGVRVMVIELHERFRPGCSRAFLRATQDSGFLSFQRRENLICYRPGALAHT
jgi:FkbM family methyltransferase